MKYRVAAFISMIVCLEMVACSTATPKTPSTEPKISPTFVAETKTPNQEQLTPTFTELPPSETPTTLPVSIPDLQTITIENADNLSLILILKIPEYTPRSASQCGVIFSPDGRLLVGTCGSNPMPVWDVQTGALLYQLYKDDPKQIVTCDFNPEGSMIACGGVDKIITLWEAASGEKLEEFGEHDSKIWDLEFSPDGTSLITASFSDDIRLWDVENRKLKWNYEAITNFLSVGFNASGTRVAYGNLWGAVGVLDVASGERMAELNGPPGTPVGDINISPSGNILAAGSDDNKVYIWSGDDFQSLFTLEGHTGFVNGVNFSPDETLLISGSHDKTVGVWNVETRQLLNQLEGHEKTVLHVAFNPQGTLIASISWDGTVRLWGVVVEK